jgi:ornithine cyclodeaminase/alanine dehydrogenase
MRKTGTLLLNRQNVAALLTLDECISAVEQAFELYATGNTMPPGILGVPARDGGFHIKAAGLKLARTYFAVKSNGNFFQNMRRHGMPNIQGLVILCDGENGYPLAVMDSIEITIIRTGAATAVAAKHLARPGSKVATICGCGNQGRISLRALTKVHSLEKVYAYDLNNESALSFSRSLATELRIEVNVVRDLADAISQSDICVTCTPSKEYYLNRDYVTPGTFIAAVGADSEEKQELDPALLASSKVVVDILDQCATIGELHHAIEKGLATRAGVHAELGEVIAGKKSGRTSPVETIIFDSTGTALQDVAAAVVVYEKAASAGNFPTIDFAA